MEDEYAFECLGNCLAGNGEAGEGLPDSATLPYQCGFYAFNTEISCIAYGAKGQVSRAFRRVLRECRRFERLFSRTLPHSDVTRINESHGLATRVSEDTYQLLGLSLGYCADSLGTFDITVCPLTRAWDFSTGQLASPQVLCEALGHVDYRNVELWQQRGEGGVECYARLKDPLAAIDLGGTAKGYIADRLDALLQKEGIRHFLINLGGNVAVRGGKPDGSPWMIGIRNPQDPGENLGAIPLECGSVVTSGTYERGFAHDGRWLHHILDPKTGYPVESDLASASVVAQRSIDAEGYSTTLLALGRERATAFAQAHRRIVTAILVDVSGRMTQV